MANAINKRAKMEVLRVDPCFAEDLGAFAAFRALFNSSCARRFFAMLPPPKVDDSTRRKSLQDVMKREKLSLPLSA